MHPSDVGIFQEGYGDVFESAFATFDRSGETA
jgi:hypothetical protein